LLTLRTAEPDGDAGAFSAALLRRGQSSFCSGSGGNVGAAGTATAGINPRGRGHSGSGSAPDLTGWVSNWSVASAER
jgi:hypothetical protein